MKLLGKGGYGAAYEVIRQRDGKHLAIKCESAEMTKKVGGRVEVRTPRIGSASVPQYGARKDKWHVFFVFLEKTSFHSVFALRITYGSDLVKPGDEDDDAINK